MFIFQNVMIVNRREDWEDYLERFPRLLAHFTPVFTNDHVSLHEGRRYARLIIAEDVDLRSELVQVIWNSVFRGLPADQYWWPRRLQRDWRETEPRHPKRDKRWENVYASYKLNQDGYSEPVYVLDVELEVGSERRKIGLGILASPEQIAANDDFFKNLMDDAVRSLDRALEHEGYIVSGLTR